MAAVGPSFKLIVNGQEVARGILHRSVSPSAVAELERARRISGNAVVKEGSIGIPTRLKVGASKARARFRPGELAVNPADGTLWLFLSDSQTSMPMVPLGEVTEGVAELAKIKRGSQVSIIISPERRPP